MLFPTMMMMTMIDDDDDDAGFGGVHRFERVSCWGKRRITFSRTTRSLSLQLHQLSWISATSNGIRFTVAYDAVLQHASLVHELETGNFWHETFSYRDTVNTER